MVGEGPRQGRNFHCEIGPGLDLTICSYLCVGATEIQCSAESVEAISPTQAVVNDEDF
jgi:hypothetical protein